MDDRVRFAVENNAIWCDLVCRSHGIETRIADGLWVALKRAPQLYPDVVTLVPGLAAENVVSAVGERRGCAVKDSFAALDLAELDFDELFSARWIVHEPRRDQTRPRAGWTIVTEDGVNEWIEAAGLAGLVRRELARNSDVRFLAAHGPDGLAGGAIANRTGAVVGVSNVFATSGTVAELWTDLPAALAGFFPALPLVGYEHGEPLDAALAAGFTGIGELRVWVRRSTAT